MSSPPGFSHRLGGLAALGGLDLEDPPPPSARCAEALDVGLDQFDLGGLLGLVGHGTGLLLDPHFQGTTSLMSVPRPAMLVAIVIHRDAGFRDDIGFLLVERTFSTANSFARLPRGQPSPLGPRPQGRVMFVFTDVSSMNTLRVLPILCPADRANLLRRGIWSRGARRGAIGNGMANAMRACWQISVSREAAAVG